jgi:hypothetical protein
MKKRYFRINMKFGIEIPKSMERAMQIDTENGNTFWTDAIKKEMSTVMIAFEILPKGSKPPPGFAKLTGHLVFDCHAGSLLGKARCVGDGHKLDEPDVCTYASVVSRESVRLAFMLAALNGLDVLAADAEEAYLNAPSREKLYMKLGIEFGEFKGRIAIVRRALYGTKSAAVSWRATISKVVWCSTPFSAAILEYCMTLRECLMGLRMPQDSKCPKDSESPNDSLTSCPSTETANQQRTPKHVRPNHTSDKPIRQSITNTSQW